MRITSAALLVSGLAAQQVAATWDKNAYGFKSPESNNNECSDKQKGGFNFKDIPTGSFSNYGDFNFGGGNGWKCADSFGKRDGLTKRTFDSRCAKTSVGKQQPASFDCGNKKKDGFSVTSMQVSVEFDCDLEFHYKMPDNSVCKQVSSCKKEGTTVQNTQCGGAQSVQVYLGGKPQKESCEIGFHNIGFDCSPGYGGKSSSVVVSQPTPSPSKPAESKPAESKPATTPVESKPASTPVYSQPASTPKESKPASTPVYSQPAESKPASSKPVESVPVSTPGVPSSPVYNNSSAPAVQSTPVQSKPASTPAQSQPGYSAPGYSAPGNSAPVSSAAPVQSTSAQLTTSVIYSTVTNTVTSCAGTVTNCPANKASTIVQTSVVSVGVTVCPVTPTAPSAPSSTPSAPGAPNGGAPPVLPKCMNTWLQLKSSCKDNTDYNCYCKNPDFTKSVIECVSAWASDSETQAALSYLAGICAPYVPQNPGIITNCPSTVTLAPSAPAASAVAPSGSAPAPNTTPALVNIPVTTITYQTAVTVPCSSAGKEVPGSSTVSTIKSTVTVPQVVFTTASPGQPGASSQPINLVPGTPPPAPAQTTAPYPIPSGLSTAVYPTGGVNATGSVPPQFTGAASQMSYGSFTLMGAILAFFAL